MENKVNDDEVHSGAGVGVDADLDNDETGVDVDNEADVDVDVEQMSSQATSCNQVSNNSSQDHVYEMALMAQFDVDERHLPATKIKRQYTCSDCGLRTCNPRQHLRHRKMMHNPKIRIVLCPLCIYACQYRQKLNRHLKLIHECTPNLVPLNKNNNLNLNHIHNSNGINSGFANIDFSVNQNDQFNNSFFLQEQHYQATLLHHHRRQIQQQQQQQQLFQQRYSSQALCRETYDFSSFPPLPLQSSTNEPLDLTLPKEIKL